MPKNEKRGAGGGGGRGGGGGGGGRGGQKLPQYGDGRDNQIKQTKHKRFINTGCFNKKYPITPGSILSQPQAFSTESN